MRGREGQKQNDGYSERNRRGDTNMPSGRSRSFGGSSNSIFETNQLWHYPAYHLLLWNRRQYFKLGSAYQTQYARNRLHLHERLFSSRASRNFVLHPFRTQGPYSQRNRPMEKLDASFLSYSSRTFLREWLFRGWSDDAVSTDGGTLR